ncbi:hypothetical protein COV18_01970 [Candidatus Woesearchaeota archaeon CG10_big_fil_rev_8_21_14_0_10_37_12]|nr:MAG: hypothetical protein COV18_01970 [Candidatus Woesearchaeota archaeon CG10_big_fil_rev_8_21_14_0_10_37_12]
MKFAHIADCHIGSWRDPKLRAANTNSFKLAIDICIKEHVDFLLISGDLFNTAVPAIDSLRMTVEQLKKIKDNNIPVYFIAGSHDFSPSGKTMLDVLEQAGLAINVAKGEELSDGRIRLHFTVDPKTNVKITGMIGKKGSLETGYYHFLAKEYLENEPGKKIFLFHSALAELKPKELEKMDAMPVSLLPANFDYYAGGHVHVVDRQSIDDRNNIVYPGPIFPNNFSEIEKLQHGSFVIVNDDEIRHVPLHVHNTVCLTIDSDNKTVSDVELEIKKQIASADLKNAVVTIRVQGCLKQGKPADVHWNDVFHDCYAKQAYVVLKNTNRFTSKELEMITIKEANVEDVENKLLEEHSDQFKLSDNDVLLAKQLMRVLSDEKKEGERITDFETRLHGELDVLLQKE